MKRRLTVAQAIVSYLQNSIPLAMARSTASLKASSEFSVTAMSLELDRLSNRIPA